VTGAISRRSFLLVGGAGVVATAVGGIGLVRSSGSGFDPVVGGPLRSPPVLASSGGVLVATLEAARSQLPVAGRVVTALGYNGGLPGPTLRVHPGDLVRVSLVNRLDGPTNLHVHGLTVSPEGNGDNVFRRVAPGETGQYEYRLPADHPPGVFWYHPHVHGAVADQVFGGLYGAIIVEDPAASAIAARDEVMVISDTTIDGGEVSGSVSAMQRMRGREGELLLLNGQASPTIAARPGERVRWRVVNACASRYVTLQLEGHRFGVLGVDSGRTAAPQDTEQVTLAPGNRADLLITAAAGRSVLRALPHDRGGSMMGGTSTGQATTLATLEVTGEQAAAPSPVPVQPVPTDLRGAPISGRRTLTFAMGMGMGMGGGMTATIDGATFDPRRVDQDPRSGTVEEWVLRNTSSLSHPVHLHVWPMQVLSQDGTLVVGVVVRDVVDVPAGASVTVRIAFTGPVGRTVYHCHILDHEDAGMMGVVDVR
jgi:FtsP/CotA-like multicopper oxidase with cupredoxin domain